jgi:TRAP-type mannitol/chloroaromatic compound transport system permease small subunit
MNSTLILLSLVLALPVAFGLYVAWLVVPAVVRTVVPEVVRAVKIAEEERQI